MKKMKKFLVAFLSMFLVVGALGSCDILDSFGGLFDSISESTTGDGEKKETYTITFRQSGKVDVTKTVEEGATLTDIPTPAEKPGYDVDTKWYADEACITEATFTNIQANAIVYAKETAKTYTITYELNGGSFGEDVANTQTVTFDAAYTLLTKEAVTRVDWEFIGWVDSENKTVANSGKWTIAENVTLTASWLDKRPTFTVTFTDGTQVTKVQVKKGESVAEADIPEFVGKTGYEPTWSKTGNELTNIQEDMDVTAEYTANTYTATYDAEGFDIDGTRVTLTYDAKCSALDMTLTSTEKKFLGWVYNGKTYTKESIWDVAENVTLTASWAEKDQVVVSFVDTDGSTIKKTVYEGNNLEEIPTPKDKIGYKVDKENWYTTAGCATVATFTNITADFTVYAKATPETYTITYNANGGSITETTQTVTYDAEYTLATPTHEKDYMQFVHWKNDSGAIISSGIWKTDGNISLTAEWKDTRAEYTISFVQAGQETKTYTVKEGESFTNIPTPAAKPGYNIVWDKTEFTNVTDNITVNAVETAKTYTITLDAGDGEVEQTTITVTYGEAYTLPTPTIEDENKEFNGWVYNETQKIPTTGTWRLDLDNNITLEAVWKEVGWTANY